MKICEYWYLDTNPSVYKKDPTRTLQQQLNDSVKKEMAMLLEKQEKKKTSEDDYEEVLYI